MKFPILKKKGIKRNDLTRELESPYSFRDLGNGHHSEK